MNENNNSPVNKGPGIRQGAIRRYSLGVLSGLGYLFFVALGIWSISQQHGVSSFFACTITILYVAWQISESFLSKKEIVLTTAPEDKNTTEFAAAAKGIFMLAAFFPHSTIYLWSAILGLLVFCYGVYIRRSAILSLGELYTNRIRFVDGPVGVSGPYSQIRHPAYLGTLCAHLGVLLIFLNIYSLLAFALLWLPIVVVRVLIEEKLLIKNDYYVRYSAETPYKLFRGLW